jgi:hypothetical protein
MQWRPFKPWMTRRPEESVAKHNDRLYRTCFACGQECTSRAACDEHEDTCPRVHSQGHHTTKKGDT